MAYVLAEFQQLARSSHKRLQNDVRSSDGDVAGPSQETLQGGVGQEILEGESDFCFFKVMEGCVCVRVGDVLYAVFKKKKKCAGCWRILSA